MLKRQKEFAAFLMTNWKPFACNTACWLLLGTVLLGIACAPENPATNGQSPTVLAAPVEVTITTPTYSSISLNGHTVVPFRVYDATTGKSYLVLYHDGDQAESMIRLDDAAGPSKPENWQRAKSPPAPKTPPEGDVDL